MARISTQLFTGYSLWSHGSEAAAPPSVNALRENFVDTPARRGLSDLH
jgi:hypothetical protein